MLVLLVEVESANARTGPGFSRIDVFWVGVADACDVVSTLGGCGMRGEGGGFCASSFSRQLALGRVEFGLPPINELVPKECSW